MKKCNNCGSFCPDNAKFCSSCGNKLNCFTQPLSVTATPENASQKNVRTDKRTTGEHAKKRQKKPWLLFWISAAVTANALTFLLYIIFSTFVYNRYYIGHSSPFIPEYKYSDLLGIFDSYYHYEQNLIFSALFTVFLFLIPGAIAFTLSLRRIKKNPQKQSLKL